MAVLARSSEHEALILSSDCSLVRAVGIERTIRSVLHGPDGSQAQQKVGEALRRFGDGRQSSKGSQEKSADCERKI